MLIHISLKTVIEIIICIAILFWLLNRYLFKPIIQILDTRQAAIQGSQSKADESLRSIAEKIARYKNALNHAREEAEENLKETIAQAIKEKQKVIADAEEKSQKLIDQKLKDIKKEENKARRLLDKEVSLLAGRITETLIKQ